MRIPNASPPSVSTSSFSSYHSSPPSSTTTAASSTDSSTSSHAPSSASSSTRCVGLDLLVKAIHHVATGGSIVGVPYIQRRSVIRRRRRSNYLGFNQLFVTGNMGSEERAKGSGSEPKLKKQRRRVMALPSKYQDSVLQPWRLRSRSVIEISD
ncbi:hypothetical protein Vadar_017246 [Vaccinium darrowii]|uniref:Uncharacterized protein n=1 Tax=Vaccinium darrowii TaxID=229202 RepID=A0ACB7ZCE9_9ERIC|nr:hypothetical protein Vadar_017246 [Vaccinium darrowii]